MTNRELPPGWTVDTLRIYIEAEIASIRTQLELRHETETKALDAALAAQSKAVDKAEAAAEKRFDAVNGFREQLAEQASHFMPRAESVAKHESTGEKLDAQVELVSSSMAELRAQMNDLALRFMPRKEAETHDASALERLREVEIRMQSYPNREETALALAAADAKFAAGVKSITDKSEAQSDRLSALDLRVTSRLDLASGKSAGYGQVYAWLATALVMVVAVLTIVGVLM